MKPIIEHHFLSFFDPDSAAAMAAIATIIELADQEVLFSEGDTPDALYLVLEGCIDVLKNNSAGQPQIIAHILENDFIGELAILDGGPRSATARASGAARVAAISRDVVLEHLSHSAAGLDLTLKIVSRIRTSNQLRVEELMRQEKMSIVGRMINGIIHDFRNPFAVILMLAGLIRRMHPDVAGYCDTISEQIDRLTGMTEDVLEYSRGGSALKVNALSPEAMLARFARMNQDYLASLKIDLVIEAVDGRIEGDEDKLLRVLQNLVSNAAHALEPEGGQIKITAAFADTGELAIEVSDNGPGIPEQVRHNLFEAFSTYGKKNGIGLGMAITHAIIQAHGGSIRFETATGQGTTFYIQLPPTVPKPA
jgi:signal transduction histidine kinase